MTGKDELRNQNFLNIMVFIQIIYAKLYVAFVLKLHVISIDNDFSCLFVDVFVCFFCFVFFCFVLFFLIFGVSFCHFNINTRNDFHFPGCCLEKIKHCNFLIYIIL